LRRDAKVALVARVPLFERCSRRELGKIASIAREIEYPAATPVVHEGRRGDEFFIVVEGEVDVRRGGRKLATIGAGDFFGEIALITGSPRTATVITGTPLRALFISSRDFRELLQDSPGVQYKLMQEMGRRLEEMSSAQKPRRIRSVP
jgi:CRP/FNR family cyclic AMP-dependent transcriptional regulator